MSKYNSTSVRRAALLIETNGSHAGAAFAVLGGNLKREHVKTAIAIFDSLERAPWWEEVGSDYRFEVNEPCRFEGPATTVEGLVKDGGPIGDGLEPNERAFRDTRWTPPPAPLAVGDVIETKEQAEALPVGTIVRRELRLPRQKTSQDRWRNGWDNKTNAQMATENYIVAYLPEATS